MAELELVIRLQVAYLCFGVVGHNCVWHQQLPAWVTNGHFNAADLTSIIQTHCSTLVGHFKGQTCASRFKYFLGYFN